MEKHLLVIDTDPGVDDALAILMAFAHPRAEVLALTTTAGNVGLAHTTANALRLLEVVGAELPVHPGCATPLVLPADDAAFVHGNDGFGDAGLPPPAREPEREPAALAMIRMAWQRPHELTFVMLGPLTNLALALRIDPDLPRRVKRLVIMGGAVTGRGNVARIPVEFNIGFDPEAAHVVFSGWPSFEVADWEATMRHGFPFATLAGWLRSGDPRARFYDAISAKTREFMRRSRHPDLWHAADALAMAMVLEPHNVQAAHARHVGVELTGTLTRGATVVDWDQRGGKPANARLLETFDPGRFQGLMAAALGA